MLGHVAVHNQLIDVFSEMSALELKFTAEVLDRVAEPLLAVHKEFDARRKKLLASEEKLEQNLRVLKGKIKDERANCIKMWKETQDAYRAMQKANGDIKKVTVLFQPPYICIYFINIINTHQSTADVIFVFFSWRSWINPSRRSEVRRRKRLPSSSS
jgi:hypothetical protein